MVQEMLIDAGPPRPMPQAPLSGWVLATSVLLAARLARTTAEANRFDLDSLQVTTPLSTCFLPLQKDTESPVTTIGSVAFLHEQA